MPCDKRGCTGHPTIELSCQACGEIISTCREHLQQFICDCGRNQWYERPVNNIPLDLLTGERDTTVSLDGSGARHVGNVVQPPPNRISILSWNLQNFTSDKRMGRSNGPISSKNNQIRSMFVAAVTAALQADVLLLMETGTDIAEALHSIQVPLYKLTGREYNPIVSGHTHNTPDVQTKHRISVSPIPRDVFGLRLLLRVFEVNPGKRKQVDVARAIELLAALRSVTPWQFGGGDPFASCIDTLIIEIDDPERRDLVQFLLPQRLPQSPEELVMVMKHLAAIRAIERGVGKWENVCTTDVLTVMMLAALVPDGWSPSQIENLIAPFDDDNIALSAFLLLGYDAITLELEEGQLVNELEDADLLYEALRHFGKVDFHFETYGALWYGSNERRQEMLSLKNNWSIIRFDGHGQLLGTQRPGSSYNWRSAMRAALPLPGGKWIDLMLFHTRFTPSREALQDTTEKTALDRTYSMRAQGVVTVGDFAVNQIPLDVPIVYLGDFNLPMGEDREVLRRFSSQMEALGYSRLPGTVTPTTLCTAPTIAENPDAYYSQAYDAAYIANLLPECAGGGIVAIEYLLKILPEEIIELLQPAAARAYKKFLEELYILLIRRRLEIVEMDIRSRQQQEVYERAVRRARQFPGLQMLLSDDDQVHGIRALFNARLVAFQQRKISVNADPFQDPIASLRDECDSLFETNEWKAVNPRWCVPFNSLRGQLNWVRGQLDNMDTNLAVRFAVGYVSVVSDHMPLFVQLDLDQPLGSQVLPYGSCPSSTSGIPLTAWGNSVGYPANGDAFLEMQGRSLAERGRFQSELQRIGRREGQATPVANDCLLHTLRQFEAGGEIDVQDAKLVELRDQLGLQSGSMIAIGAEPILGFLQKNSVRVNLYMLNLDGTLTGPIAIGAAQPTTTIDVLHYGAHYVPLWPI